MKNASIIREYDPEAINGVAEMTESQLRSIQNQNSARLRKDLTYVIAPQWVHNEKLATAINGNDISKKIFAVGVDAEGTPVQIVSLSVNGLRQRHYGLVSANPTLKVVAEKNADGLYRPVGATTYSVFSEGALPIRINGKQAYISRPFAFKVNSRGQVFVVNEFKKVAKGYDMAHFTEDGKEYLKLGYQTVNDYAEVMKVPEVDWNEIVDEKSKVLFDNLPQA